MSDYHISYSCTPRTNRDPEVWRATLVKRNNRGVVWFQTYVEAPTQAECEAKVQDYLSYRRMAGEAVTVFNSDEAERLEGVYAPRK